jgi:hypothetical protein
MYVGGMSVCGIQTWTDHDPLLTHASYFHFHISSVRLKITRNQSVSFMIFLTGWILTFVLLGNHFYQSWQYCNKYSYGRLSSGFGGLEVTCWPMVPKFAGSNPAEAVGFFGRKNLNTPSFGGEGNPSVPCRALRHVKEPKSDVEVANLGKISRPFLAHSSTFRC